MRVRLWMSSEKLENMSRIIQMSDVRHLWALAVPSGVCARSKESTKKTLPSGAGFTAPTTVVLSVECGTCRWVNIEKIAKGLRLSLRDYQRGKITLAGVGVVPCHSRFPSSDRAPALDAAFLGSRPPLPVLRWSNTCTYTV